MEENLEGMWGRIADILNKYATSSDFALFNSVLEELAKTAEEQQIIIELMAKDIAENKLDEDICSKVRSPEKEECDCYADMYDACYGCVIEFYKKKAKGE